MRHSNNTNNTNNINPACNHCEHKQKVPLLYLYVFRLMIDKLGKNDQITSSKQLLEVWRRNIYNVPRSYDFHILSEMQYYGLVKRINTQKYIFYGCRSSMKLKQLNKNLLWQIFGIIGIFMLIALIL